MLEAWAPQEPLEWHLQHETPGLIAGLLVLSNYNCGRSRGGCYVLDHVFMVENLKVFVANEAFSAFFLGFLLDLLRLSFNLVFQG